MYKIVYVALYTALVIVVHAMLNIKKYVVRKTFSSFPFPNQEDSAFSLSNKKAPLSSQKTLNKQDEVIGTTACPALMRMAPLIGLQLTQLLPAPLFFPLQPVLSEHLLNAVYYLQEKQHCERFYFESLSTNKSPSFCL